METYRIEHCNNRCVANGYCAKHYMQIRKTGKLNDLSDKICSVEDCNSDFYAKCYCSEHYIQYLLKGGITTSKIYKNFTVEGCGIRARLLVYASSTTSN